MTHELTLIATHPGVDLGRVRAATGWDLAVSDDVGVTQPPTDDELRVLRDLKARTEAAHSASG